MECVRKLHNIVYGGQRPSAPTADEVGKYRQQRTMVRGLSISRIKIDAPASAGGGGGGGGAPPARPAAPARPEAPARPSPPPRGDAGGNGPLSPDRGRPVPAMPPRRDIPQPGTRF